jgi:transcriptional regulator with XRE-family HTH domain
VVSGAGELPILAVRLREARERLGIAQVELGRRIGMDPGVASPRINQYENGVHVPHHTTASRIARKLGVPLAYLYAEDDQLARWILVWTQLGAGERRRLLKELESRE